METNFNPRIFPNEFIGNKGELPESHLRSGSIAGPSVPGIDPGVGTHRRIIASSLLEYKRRDDQRRREAADELTQLGQEMGMI